MTTISTTTSGPDQTRGHGHGGRAPGMSAEPDDADHAALALEDRYGADLPVLHQMHDLLERGPAADGGDRVGHDALTMCGVPCMVTPSWRRPVHTALPAPYGA